MIVSAQSIANLNGGARIKEFSNSEKLANLRSRTFFTAVNYFQPSIGAYSSLMKEVMNATRPFIHELI